MRFKRFLVNYRSCDGIRKADFKLPVVGNPDAPNVMKIIKTSKNLTCRCRFFNNSLWIPVAFYGLIENDDFAIKKIDFEIDALKTELLYKFVDKKYDSKDEYTVLREIENYLSNYLIYGNKLWRKINVPVYYLNFDDYVDFPYNICIGLANESNFTEIEKCFNIFPESDIKNAISKMVKKNSEDVNLSELSTVYFEIFKEATMNQRFLNLIQKV